MPHRGNRRRAALVLGALMLAAACRRQDIREVTIHVPAMADDTTAQIVRNALENELNRADQQFSADPGKGQVSYTGGRPLHFAETHRRVENSLRAVGLSGKVLRVDYVPYCPKCGAQALLVPQQGGWMQCTSPKPSPECPRTLSATAVGQADAGDQFWASRRVMHLSLTSLTNNATVNIAIAAIAHGVRGQDNPDIRIDPQARTATVAYESLNLSVKNLEHAIAASGLDANNVPALLKAPDALRHGW
jgi:hypothetical protein